MVFYDEEINKAKIPSELLHSIYCEMEAYSSGPGDFSINHGALMGAIGTALGIRGNNLDLDLPDVPSDIAGLINWCITCEKIMAEETEGANVQIVPTSILIEIADALQNVHSTLAGPKATEAAFITHPNMFGMTDSTEFQLPKDSKGMYKLCDSALKIMSKIIIFHSTPITETVDVFDENKNVIRKISDHNVVQLLVKAKASIKKLDGKLTEFVRLHENLSDDFHERFTPETTSEEDFKWLLHHLSDAYADMVDATELKVINDASYEIRNFGELGIAAIAQPEQKKSKKETLGKSEANGGNQDKNKPEVIKIDLDRFNTGPKELLKRLTLTPKGVAGSSREAKNLRAVLRDNKGDEYEKVADCISKPRGRTFICIDTKKITLKAKE